MPVAAGIKLAKYVYTWTPVTLATAAITADGNGKYTVGYTGAQNLDTVNGTQDGDVFSLRADYSGAGSAPLTIRSGQGNIVCNGGVDIVLASDLAWCEGRNVGGTICVTQLFGPA